MIGVGLGLSGRLRAAPPEITDYPTRWGLVSHWTLDEASGNRADSHGANTLADNNTVTGATGLAANTGTASQFTKTNLEYLSAADAAGLSPGVSEFWIAGWFSLAAVPADDVYLAFKGSGLTTDTIEFSVRYIMATGLLRVLMGNSTGGLATAVSATSFGTIPTTTPVFFVAWRNAADLTLGIRVNNGATDTTSTVDRFPNDTAGDFLIGARIGPAQAWDGVIDNVSWGKAPPGGVSGVIDEISNRLYGAGAGRAYPF